MEEKIESILYAWTGITCTQRNGRKEKWRKHFFFFIRMNSEMVILLNANILTYYL